MQIVREKPCHRRHHRVTAPLAVTLPDGAVVTATDWSVGGLRIDGLNGIDAGIGDSLTLTLQLPFQGFDISFDVEARLVRRMNHPEQGDSLAFEFAALEERSRDLMVHFIDDLIRGKMASVDDTICRIDVPVTPISTKPDANPVADMQVRRWPVKTIVMSTLYLCLGVAILGYLGLLIVSKTLRMEVQSAVVNAPVATLKMPADGLLLPVSMQPGMDVRKGQEIARIEDAALNARIDQQSLLLEEARQDLRRVRERYRIEAGRMELYKVIVRTDLQTAQARVAAAREALSAADANLDRMATLQEKGLIQKARHDEAIKRQAHAEAELVNAESHVERWTAMNGVSDRKYYNHKEFVSDLDMLTLQVDEAQSAVSLALQRLERLQDLKKGMVLVAPFDGRIVTVQQVGHTNVMRNEPLLTIQKTETPTVIAFLDQEQIIQIGMNDRAQIFVPSMERHIEARVVRIDRNLAFLKAATQDFRWQEGYEKSAMVSLALDAEAADSIGLAVGLPVVAIFDKRSTSYLNNVVGKTVFRRLGLDGHSV